VEGLLNEWLDRPISFSKFARTLLNRIVRRRSDIEALERGEGPLANPSQWIMPNMIRAHFMELLNSIEAELRKAGPECADQHEQFIRQRKRAKVRPRLRWDADRTSNATMKQVLDWVQGELEKVADLE
jgi:hypothetical protein